MIVLGGQRSPQNSAHHEHQRFWPRVSEAAGGFENAETIVNTVAFVLSGILPRGAGPWCCGGGGGLGQQDLQGPVTTPRAKLARAPSWAFPAGARARRLEGLAGAPSFHTPIVLGALPAPGRGPLKFRV